MFTLALFYARMKAADGPGLDPVHALSIVIFGTTHARTKMIKHGYVHAAFKSDASQCTISPNDFSKGCIDPVHANGDAVADVGKTCGGSQLASAFRYVEDIRVDRARLHAPFDHKLQGSPI